MCAQSYDLPREFVMEALFIDLDAPPRRVSLDKIADENGVTLAELQVRIDAALAAWRATPEGAARE